MSLKPNPRSLEVLGRALACRGYHFVCPTPATYEIVINRRTESRADLRDIFGWNRPFAGLELEPEILSLMRDGDLIDSEGLRSRSRLRFSTAGKFIFAHSSYPTTSEDAVFFGPDTYRFISFIERSLRKWRPRDRAVRILDLGCGSGAGGIIAASAFTGGVELTLSDINATALIFAEANAAIAGQNAAIIQSDLFAALDGQFDLIVMNPPYLCDDRERLYRHGGDDYGTALPVKMVKESIGRLAQGGLLLAYSGAAIVRGEDSFWAKIEPLIPEGATFAYDEIDPDIFSEELANPDYAEVDRIAAVTLQVERC